MEKLLPIGVFILLFSFSCKKTDKSIAPFLKEPVSQLNKYTHPIKSTLPTSSLADLSPLHKIGDSKIIAMGEATHGTKEFFQLKHKIFRYLVEKHNFRVFAFEADMGEAFYLNQYIQGGDGNIAQIMADKMHFWTWKTKEVKALLDWMRSYNEGKPSSERVYFIGLDAQYMTYQPELLTDYLKRINSKLLGEAQSLLENITELSVVSRRQTLNQYKKMSKKRRGSISDSLSYLMQKMDTMKERMIEASSKFEYQTTYQLVRNLQQVHQHLYAYHNLDNINLRDQYMAENALWASGLFGEETKIALWAHNGHISESKSSMFTPMGNLLNKKIENRYRSIAFSFCKGSFTAIGVDTATNKRTGIDPHLIEGTPVKGSINYLFSLAQNESFILNIDSLQPNSALSNWLSEEHGFLQIGAVYNSNSKDYYRQIILPESFDVIIHVDSTTHSNSVL